MAHNKYMSSVKYIKFASMPDGVSACMGCGFSPLTYCGKPFSTKIECQKCGAVNIYEESQIPVRFVPNEPSTHN
jgi:hypothetical protein